MRALIVIVALGVIGTFGCAAADTGPEQKEASQSNLFGWGKSYKSSGSYQGSGSSSSSSASSYVIWDGKNYKSSGGSYASSGTSHGSVDTTPAPVPAADDTPLGAYGDSCASSDDCASHVCSPDEDGFLYCSN